MQGREASGHQDGGAKREQLQHSFTGRLGGSLVQSWQYVTQHSEHVEHSVLGRSRLGDHSLAMRGCLACSRVWNQVRARTSHNRDNCMLACLPKLGLLVGGEGEEGGEVVGGLRKLPSGRWLHSQQDGDAAE